MVYLNELLLLGVLLMLIALLLTKHEKPQGELHGEVGALRRKIDLLHIQTTAIMKHLGLLREPSEEVKTLINSGDTLYAAQRLREETGLTLKESKEMVKLYMEKGSMTETDSVIINPDIDNIYDERPDRILTLLETVLGRIEQLARNDAESNNNRDGAVRTQNRPRLSRRGFLSLTKHRDPGS